ncbi:imidazolonepropionase [Halomonas sp. DP5Y7-2]|uniref:imidazolonepropionase n=1 Tax=Halomonas sp. DP5Y7-2 TaxID=2859076 RepID=UPI001C99AC00|nr:imidazolonepropionase [Halomonas sp. DP5Y7-2]MBY5986160.1 imidazolonepropionase [Halomonas sp. DP5Y7-2]
MATTSQPQHPSRLWRDLSLFDGLTTQPGRYWVKVEDGRIAAMGAMDSLDQAQQADCIDMGSGGVMTPGLIDCHTHLVYGGQRSDEFELRLEGASYEDISRRGGGILGTVQATRDADEAALFTTAATRLGAMIDDGVTSVEIKSGYGLSTDDELKMLRVARRLGRELPVRVSTTLLAAHALPPEYHGNADGYIDLVCNEILPAAHAEGLVDAVDVFCERIAFSREQCLRVFEAARALDLPVKAHAEQLSLSGGASLVAEHHGLSADHIEYLDDAGIAAMAEAGTVGVLLPGAFYTLRETQHPPIDAMRRAGVAMAVASDANPGTSPIMLPTLMLNMACTLLRLTPQEALAGMTAHAATAIGTAGLGRITVGAIADLCVWDVQRPAELAYAVQPGRLRHRVLEGVLTHG